MGYLLKYTATKDTWGLAVKAGETFIVDQGTNAASGASLQAQLRKMGRTITTYSSIVGGALKVGETTSSNEWIIERIK
jgi:phage tail sheath protein FI